MSDLTHSSHQPREGVTVRPPSELQRLTCPHCKRESEDSVQETALLHGVLYSFPTFFQCSVMSGFSDGDGIVFYYYLSIEGTGPERVK